MWWTRSTPSLIVTGLTDLFPPSCRSGSDGPVLKFKPMLPTRKFLDVPLKIKKTKYLGSVHLSKLHLKVRIIVQHANSNLRYKNHLPDGTSSFLSSFSNMSWAPRYSWSSSISTQITLSLYKGLI